MHQARLQDLRLVGLHLMLSQQAAAILPIELPLARLYLDHHNPLQDLATPRYID
jgi:hypothetical protein